MDITIQSIHVDLTARTRRLVEQSLAEALRFLGPSTPAPILVQVELERAPWRYGLIAEERRHDPSYRAVAAVSLTGTTLWAQGVADDLRRALVEMKRELTGQISDWRPRRRAARRSPSRGPVRASVLLRWNERPLREDIVGESAQCV